MLEPALPPDVPQPLDLELLAWAAGFFDGEGSTIARTDARRPEYHQLDVSVPQAGHDGMPAVLVKFQRAMLGVGAIYPQHRDDLFKWSARGRVGAELALALMWPWLGAVKRTQALVALRKIADQFDSGRYRRRRPRYVPRLLAHSARREGTAPERLRLAWAAGFLDAEGYFGNPRGFDRKDGTIGLTIRVSASQHGLPHSPAEVLLQLREILGGRIEAHGEIDDFKWVAEGVVNVTRIAALVEPWIGDLKLRQAHTAIDAASALRVRGTDEHCIRGHVYDRVYVRPDGTIHRVCNACERIRRQAARAALGSKRRMLRNVSADPSRIYAA